MKKNLKRLMGFILMPVSFTVIGYAIIALALSPFFEVAVAAANLLTMNEVPSFSTELVSIFDEEAVITGQPDYLYIEDIELPAFGTHYAQVRNSRIGLNAPVFWGDTYEILRHGVGHFNGSFLPGFGGTVLLAGHNMTHFLPLQDIEIGDVVELTTNFAHFEYEVVKLLILDHRDPAAIDLGQRDQDLLVMYTCYPFTFAGITPWRLFVYAERISGPDIIYQVD